MRLSKLLGITLYFVGIGIWVFLFFVGIIALFSLILPTVVLAFIAGICTNTFRKSEPWPAFRRMWLWKWAREKYFNFEVSGHEEALKLFEKEKNKLARTEKRKVMYAIYPHGHFSITAVFLFGLNPALEHITGCVHSLLFWLPVIGSLVGWLGCTSVTEEDMVNALNKNGRGRIFMCPGGVADMANTGKEVKKRRGFLRVAKSTNTIVIPIWCPEERSYYRQWLPFGTVLQRYLFFPVPMFLWGCWWCPILPRMVGKSRVIMGKPITWKREDGEDQTLEQGEDHFWKEIESMQKVKCN